MAELPVGHSKVDHPMGVCASEPNHGGGREHIEHQLGCRPRFHSCRACDNLRAYDGHYCHIGGSDDGSTRVRGQSDGLRPQSSRITKSAERIRRGPTRGNPHQRVPPGEPQALQVPNGECGFVFYRFNRTGQRAAAPCQHPDDAGCPERRDTLRCVEDTQAPTGSRSKVNQASAFSDGARCGVDGARNLRKDLFHGSSDVLIFSVDDLKYLARGASLKFCRGGMGPFGYAHGSKKRLKCKG